ncbi:MAG: hypothetical protein WBG92_09570 [Thiohalocapsa sp.]
MLRPLTALFDSLRGRRAGSDAPDQDLASDDGRLRLRLRDYFTLRPYGRNLITPAVSVWLGSAWVLILLMASIEGFVWGAVGASLVPSASRWMAMPVAGFMFLLLFAIVWIIDSSLIMSERPSLRLRQPHAADQQGIGPTVRWFLGLLVRVAIVSISLYVTAPFIEKLIRADDIAGWPQVRVEQYFKDRDATIQNQISARAEQMDAGLSARIASLEQEIARLSASLQAEQERRAGIEAVYAPEIEVLSRDLADALARVGDEVLGRDGRAEGYGPEARKWDARAKLVQEKMDEIQTEREARLSGIETAIAAQQERLRERSDALEQVRIAQAQLMTEVSDAVTAEQPPPAPPRLTFAARSKGLSDLRNSPDEAGVPHFETVEGFAQAALGILFFALIALKLFEPAAVHAYFSEVTQFQYRKYLAGGLADIPGFELHDDPVRRLSPVAFYRLWERYEQDPDDYFEQIQAVVGVEARVRRLLADQAYELELLERQREDIDDRLRLDRRRREVELAARERELNLRLDDARKRLSAETDAEIERLEAQRTEARRAHAIEMEQLAINAAAERQRVDDELADRRREWEQQHAAEEEELRRKRQTFEDSRQNAQDEMRLRRTAIDDQRRLREIELQQAATDSDRAQQRAARQLRMDETRALIANEREIQNRRRAEISELRTGLSQMLGRIAEHEGEQARLTDRLMEREQRMETLRRRIDEASRAAPATGSRWRIADPVLKTRRNAERRLKDLESERSRMQDRNAALGRHLSQLRAERDGMAQSLAELEADAVAIDARIERYRHELERVLLLRG